MVKILQAGTRIYPISPLCLSFFRFSLKNTLFNLKDLKKTEEKNEVSIEILKNVRL